MKKILLVLLLASPSLAGTSVQTQDVASPNALVSVTSWTVPGTYSFTIPKTYSLVATIAGGGGGGGIGDLGYSGCGGGGGGAIVSIPIAVTPGDVYTIIVGTGGLSGDDSTDFGNYGSSSAVISQSGQVLVSSGGAGGNLGDDGGDGGGDCYNASYNMGGGASLWNGAITCNGAGPVHGLNPKCSVPSAAYCFGGGEGIAAYVGIPGGCSGANLGGYDGGGGSAVPGYGAGGQGAGVQPHPSNGQTGYVKFTYMLGM
jgi:hypothetical protein